MPPGILAALAASLLIPVCAGAIAIGQTDSFSGPSAENWQVGPADAVALADAGPEGSGDAALQIAADGGGPLGKLVTFNRIQWSGDFIAAGVTGILLDVNNIGENDLLLRVVFGTSDAPMSGGSWFASTVGVAAMAGSDWQTIFLPIEAVDLTSVQGTAAYADVMGSVVTTRLLHSAAPGEIGDDIVATLRVDNVTAVPEPGFVALFAVACGTLILAGRRQVWDPHPGRGYAAKRARRQSSALRARS